MKMLSGKLNLRLLQVMDPLMNILQAQISRATNFAISDIVIPEMKNLVGYLSSRENEFGTGMTTCHLGLGSRLGASNQLQSNKVGF